MPRALRTLGGLAAFTLYMVGTGGWTVLFFIAFGRL